MNKFEAVKKAANDLQLSQDHICKMLRLLEYAKQHGVEMYLAEGKLRMKEVVIKKEKDQKGFENIFEQFGDIFGGKKN